ncbi:WD40 repeat-containing protein [Artemisia annua]|uniref:WD40 repeat-containing protein n=1 Tax=Artemisia annua TaxID=35608 RepID=A0A2U1K9D3_ARTAN|nr:WD40 repeat-containing protein [Artemisia annua]
MILLRGCLGLHTWLLILFGICDLRLDNLDFSQRNGVAEIHNGVANERKAQGTGVGSYFKKQELAGNVVADEDQFRAESCPDLILTGHEENAEFALAMCRSEPFVLSGGKDKSVVLWSIHDHTSTLATDSGSKSLKIWWD